MRQFIVWILIVFAMPAFGDLPTAGYVSDYYYHKCANANLDIPGAGISNLTAQKYVLDIVDILNQGTTTYGPDAETNHVVSTAFVSSTLPLLGESPICCLGGYMDIDTNKCTSCGEWLVDSTDMCFDAGEYYNNGTCSPCGNGYICAAGTSSRVDCGPGYYCVGNERTKCTDGVYRCPYQNHVSEPSIRGCDGIDAPIIITSTAADECTGSGVYYDGKKCASCPAGYLCPAGTAHRVVCGAGFWCADNVRTECADGVYRCPSPTTGTVVDSKRGCDDTWVFTD